ncbi:MAG: hypothetical protein M1837_004081 [Sclerophora amabilis]|nr:MAG: hypothetical protein M1837_004081 [Sclerophora amabilis]
MASESPETTPPLAEAQAEYLRSIEKGRKLYTQLTTFEGTDRKDQGDLRELYKLDRRPMVAPGALKETLSEWNVDPKGFIYVDVRSQRMKRAEDAIYSNQVNGRDGAILNNENFKDRDMNPEGQRLWPTEIIWQSFLLAAEKDEKMKRTEDAVYSNQFNGKDGAILNSDKNPEGQRLRPSEVTWQSFLLAAERDQVQASSLRVIVRNFVINRMTRLAIWQSARESTSVDEEVPDLGKRVYSARDDGFYAMLGSVNGASTMRMLLDHKQEIGYRTVDRVVET